MLSSQNQGDGASTPPAGMAPQGGTPERSGGSAAAGQPVVGIQGVDDAILHTLVYADLFDYPLTDEEIHRYLTGYPASLSLVKEHLRRNGQSSQQWAGVSRFWFLAGREHLVDLRRQRETFSQVLWAKTRRFGRLIAALPFVRMVSVTGSLAMHNVTNPQDDVDLLIVTAEDRVWLGRALVILIVHLARPFGIELCPNYVMAESCLDLGEPSLYIAHELAQLYPLYGTDIYRRLLKSNAWMVNYLPNASPRRPVADEPRPATHRGQQWMESLLGGRLGQGLERWERERKIPRLQKLAIERGGTGTSYSAKLCKGHIDDHAAAVQERYAARLAELGL